MNNLELISNSSFEGQQKLYATELHYVVLLHVCRAVRGRCDATLLHCYEVVYRFITRISYGAMYVLLYVCTHLYTTTTHCGNDVLNHIRFQLDLRYVFYHNLETFW